MLYLFLLNTHLKYYCTKNHMTKVYSINMIFIHVTLLHVRCYTEKVVSEWQKLPKINVDDAEENVDILKFFTFRQ